MEEVEIWKSVGVYKGIDYTGLLEVSTFGNVRTLDWWIESTRRWHKGTILKQQTDKDGYKQIGFRKKVIKIHQLTLQTFKPNPDPKIYTQVNHIDEDKANNKLSNLEWVTPKENVNHGTHNAKLSNSSSKNPIVQLTFDGNLVKIWKNTVQLNEVYGHGAVWSAINRYTNIYSGYFWMYQKEYNSMTKNELVEFIKNKIEDREKRSSTGGITNAKVHGIKIVQLTLDGKVVNVWDNITDAVKNSGFGFKSIKKCADGIVESHCGYKWAYYKDYCETCETLELNGVVG